MLRTRVIACAPKMFLSINKTGYKRQCIVVMSASPVSKAMFAIVGRYRPILPCKAKRQYLLTCKVSKYCLLALQSSISTGVITLEM